MRLRKLLNYKQGMIGYQLTLYKRVLAQKTFFSGFSPIFSNFLFFLVLLGELCFPEAVFGADIKNWRMHFQDAVTPVMETITHFHSILMLILFGVVAVVLILLLFVIIRFNRKTNPIPSKTMHHTLLEIVWTLVPLVIVMAIVIPSIELIYFEDKAHDPALTIKATGHQWYWTYSYPESKIEFDSRLIPDGDIDPSKGQKRLLSVDNAIYIPVNTVVRILTTSEDVIHSWAMPAFGVKKDSIPGKLNETWIKVTKEGIYHGQCSELCGMQHGFMPIEVRVVSKEVYQKWLDEAKKKFS